MTKRTKAAARQQAENEQPAAPFDARAFWYDPNEPTRPAAAVPQAADDWPGVLVGPLDRLDVNTFRQHVAAWRRKYLDLETQGFNLALPLHDLQNLARRIDGLPPPPPLPDVALGGNLPNTPATFQVALRALDSLLRWCDEAERPATPATAPGEPQAVAVAAVTEPPETVSAKLSPNDLARKHGVSLGPLRKRLDRWRYEHDAGYSEVRNRKRNEPQFLYDESAVIPVIISLKNRATDGQQKKI